jgi:type I restriction enzyme R subunit
VKAVQTLSRLNRRCEGKIDTYVLDFANTSESIKQSFAPFYEDTWLGDDIDINLVYKYLNDLRQYYLWTEELEEQVFDTYSKTKNMGKLTSMFKPVLNNYILLSEEEKHKVRATIKAFNRFYSYMAQVVRTFDVELYKTYIFTELLVKLLPKTAHDTVDLSGKLALEQHKMTEEFSGSILLEPSGEDKTLKGQKGGVGKKIETNKDLLDNIIEKINVMYQGNFSEADRVIVETIYDAMQKEKTKLSKQVKNSDVNMFAKNIFPKIFDKIAQDCYIQQMDSFAKLFEEKSFYERVMEEMAKAMYFNLRK